MYEVTKEFKFEMAHTLTNYEGPCGNLHGHSYRCLLTLSNTELGLDGDSGMVVDFNNVKKICGEFFDSLDHCYAYNNEGSPFELALAETCEKFNKKTFEFPFRTTAENMSRYIFEEVNQRLASHNCCCAKVVLYETATGCASYFVWEV